MQVFYPAVIRRQEPTGYLVRFVDFPEALTEGDTIEEALFNASEVLSLALDQRLEKEREVPVPSRPPKGAYLVAPDAKTQSALLVRLGRGDRTMAELARALGTSWPAAARLENPKHSPTLQNLEKAAAALGKKLVIGFEDYPARGYVRVGRVPTALIAESRSAERTTYVISKSGGSWVVAQSNSGRVSERPGKRALRAAARTKAKSKRRPT